MVYKEKKKQQKNQNHITGKVVRDLILRTFKNRKGKAVDIDGILSFNIKKIKLNATVFQRSFFYLPFENLKGLLLEFWILDYFVYNLKYGLYCIFTLTYLLSLY